MFACALFEASVAVAALGWKGKREQRAASRNAPREWLQLPVAVVFRTDPPGKGGAVRRHGGRCLHGISWKLTPGRGAATRGGARRPERPARRLRFPAEDE